MRVCFWLGLLLGLLLGLPGCRQGAQPPAADGYARVAAPLPPTLHQLLYPPTRRRPAADVAYLHAHRAQWQGDSLGRLLVHHRLGYDHDSLGRPDSLAWHLRQAWRAVGPAQRRQQPGEVVSVAQTMGQLYYGRGVYDSARACFQQGIATFRAASLDSVRHPPPVRQRLPSGCGWSSLDLASCAAHLGMVSRSLGDLAGAVRYYERAALLYRQLDLPAGTVWAQCLTGEAYAEQDDYRQAAAAYDQALATARRHLPADPVLGVTYLADVVLSYYEPLLLARPHPPARANELATTLLADLARCYPHGAACAPNCNSYYLITQAQLELVPVEVALRNGQPPATASLTAAGRSLDQVVPSDHFRSDYRTARVACLGLQAWQQHAADPAAARRLLAQATALLAGAPPVAWQSRSRQQLAGYCLAMHEPALARQLLAALLPLYQRPLSPLPLSRVTGLLTRAYAGLGRYDSAYHYAQRTQALTDSLRAGRQFAALAAAEARYRTREQAGQIQLLTERGRQQATRARLAAMGAALLALLLLGLGLAFRATRRFNRQLASQAAQLETQAQRLGEQAERLGELDEAKNQFFANVSHELRTPLTLILGPLDGLLTTSPRPLPAAVRQPVELAYRHAQRLRELVNRILELTKLQAGRLSLHPVPTDVAALLRRVAGQFESLATERGIALAGPAGLPDALHRLLDADKVEQVLTNLLINALNHTPPGGRVTVVAQLPAPDGHYAVSVQDTGPGIAAAEQARIFERYYQSPQGQAQGGTGLGLALSYELAQLLGGTLTLASPPGQGATFTLRFPAVALGAESWQVEAAEVEAAPAPTTAQLFTPNSQLPPPGSLPRVLVVEDQPDLREYLRQLLAPTCEVLTAPDGQAALDLLATGQPIDLVATDAMMPRLSGTELLAHLRADPARAGVPVLMLTARADDAHRLHALAIGVDDYLTKPFVPAELLARVRTLLRHHAARQHYATLPPEPEEPVAAVAERTDVAPGETLPDLGPHPIAEQLARWQAQIADYLVDPSFGPDELATQLLLSRRTLYRRLGELTGLTPAAWLRELRLHHARQLLEAGGYDSLAAVAEAAGFANAKYFSTLYSERFGRRPGEYNL